MMLCQMALAHPSLLSALVTALNELSGGAGGPGTADEPAAPLVLPASAVQEAAVETLVTLTSGSSLKLRVALASERMLVPRLLRLVSSPPVAAHVARRAAQVLVNLADAPECHDALRQHVRASFAAATCLRRPAEITVFVPCPAQEWMMMHMALHDSQSSGLLVSEVLGLLSER